MAFTSHGHHIPGTMMADRPANVARCGGPSLCVICSREVATHKLKARPGGSTAAKSNDEATLKVLLEYLVRDLKQMNQTQAHISIETVISRIERIIHH